MRVKEKAKTSASDERAHLVTIEWERGKWSGAADKYPRKYRWHFAGQLVLEVSEVPGLGYDDGVRLDPWRSYVAMIASGHMLARLHAAFGHGVQVESYVGTAEGVLSLTGESHLGERGGSAPAGDFQRRAAGDRAPTGALPRAGLPRLLHRGVRENEGDDHHRR
jgi:hypothetical protein